MVDGISVNPNKCKVIQITKKGKTTLFNYTLKHLAVSVLPRNATFPTMPAIHITASGVSKQLSKLNPGKAASPDNLTSRILQELHHEIAPMLIDICNSSLKCRITSWLTWMSTIFSIQTNTASVKKLSCEIQLIRFVEVISDKLNERGQTDAIVTGLQQGPLIG